MEIIKFVGGLGFAIGCIFGITYASVTLSDNNVMIGIIGCIVGYMLGLGVLIKVLEND
jgi:hypothetical protein